MNRRINNLFDKIININPSSILSQKFLIIQNSCDQRRDGEC